MSFRLLLPIALIALAPVACSDGSASPSTDANALAAGPGRGGSGGGTRSGAVSVKCERRSGRSKISVDGRNLPSGSYTARVSSGASSLTSAARATVGDEVEFDFDSARDDIAQGATAIPAAFIDVSATPQVRGEILDASGSLVGGQEASCRIR